MISDAEVWNYGQAVREMVKRHGFDRNLKVLHAMEILGVANQGTLSEGEFYRAIESCRDMIKDKFCQPEDSVRQLVEEDPDSWLTYSGMKTFVKIDLENSPIYKHAASRKE